MGLGCGSGECGEGGEGGEGGDGGGEGGGEVHTLPWLQKLSGGGAL